jgi:tetratricopeptide (TPR) repeat protein
MFRDVLKKAGKPARYKNKYLRPTQIRDMLVELWDRYQNQTKDFVSATEFAALLQSFRLPDTDPGEPDDLFARSSASLANGLLEKSQLATELPIKATLAEQSRSHARAAGQAFLSVAKSREGSDDYPALLWEAATHLFQGHAFEKAIPIFENFIVAHVGGPRDFLAKIRIAECQLALSNYEAARSVLENALRESSTAVDRFRGRILLAECYSEIARHLPSTEEANKERQQLYDLGEALLHQNLSSQNQELEPQAADWRESLFALAQLLLERRRYDDAIEKFQEHVRRYPDEPTSIDAENGIATAFFESAEELTPKLVDQGISERDRAKARQERSKRLEKALTQYQLLVTHLTHANGAQPLQRQEEILLGSALARVGRIHMLLDQWEQAIESYENLAFRYLDRPECLSAYIEMATAYQKLNRPNDAATSLRQALWVIDRMDDKAFTQSDRKRDEIRRQIVDLLGTP